MQQLLLSWGQQNSFFCIQRVISGMLKLLDKAPVWILLFLAIMLGIAPLGSQPHLVEKLIMLSEGNLVRPIDIFDLFLHSIFIILLLIKLVRLVILNNQQNDG